MKANLSTEINGSSDHMADKADIYQEAMEEETEEEFISYIAKGGSLQLEKSTIMTSLAVATEAEHVPAVKNEAAADEGSPLDAQSKKRKTGLGHQTLNREDFQSAEDNERRREGITAEQTDAHQRAAEMYSTLWLLDYPSR
ncbi:hypothetical protein PG994_013882 [Apiospora phragmitis]|uniref:Uncharacterized protein n=1 Tax=Apiospora phragmitis TaxID=2905665 RepID=A0ABR1T2P7_9PEZI